MDSAPTVPAAPKERRLVRASRDDIHRGNAREMLTEATSHRSGRSPRNEMKVHLYGNTLNNSYNLTRFLRAFHIDAEMFLDDTSSAEQDYPWWEDRELSRDALPPWIHYYRTKPFFRRPNDIVRKMISDFRNCDVALVSGLGPIVSMLADVPFVFYSSGSDLNIIAMRRELLAIVRARASVRSRAARLVALMAYAPLQRRALHRADKILVLMGYQLKPVIEKYGLSSRTQQLRLAWDTAKYKIDQDRGLAAKYGRYQTVFFMVARHSWRSVWSDNKGNDKFIRAFARFVHDERPNAVFVTVAKGEDVTSSRELVRSLGIESHTEWLSEMNKDGVRRYESLPNCVVVDQFGHDDWRRKFPEETAREAVIGLGGVGVEAMSAGRLLITAFTDDALYGGTKPPILYALHQDDIYRRIVEAHAMTEGQRRVAGQAAQEWVYEWHDWHNVVPQYIDVLRQVHAATRSQLRGAVLQ